MGKFAFEYVVFIQNRNYRRKIENVGQVVIWFGAKQLTVKQLVKNLGDQFNLPVT